MSTGAAAKNKKYMVNKSCVCVFGSIHGKDADNNKRVDDNDNIK